jgi:DNA-binding transcriptional LysR family regulator
MVWIAATDNPASLAPHDLSRLCDLPRVLIAVHRPLDLPTAIENELAQIFPTLRMDADRSVGDPLVSVYDAQTAIAVVARTNSVAIVPRRLAIKAVATGQILILSESTATAPLSMLWHNKQQTDPGLAWFRATIRACLS